MDKFKLILKRRIALLIIAVLIAAATGIYDVFFAGETARESIFAGFQAGLITGLGLLSAALIIRFRSTLKDEAKLKLQYNKENDERYKAIRAKAGMPMLLITSIMMIIAGVIAGYFSETAFITLICAALAQMSVGVVVKLVYMKIM